MRIGVDYHLAIRNPNSGMGVYIREIFHHLKLQDIANKYMMIYPKRKNASKTIFNKVVELLQEQWWVQKVLPLLIKKKRISILYSPNPPAPLFTKVPIILTIPDMSFYYDKNFPKILKIYFYLMYLLSAHKACVITTFSQNSKQDIIKLLHIKENKIKIVTPGVKKIFFNRVARDESKAVLRKYKIHKPYILSVPGTFIPRKNMQDLVLAFKSLPSYIKKDYLLVLIGNTEDSYFIDFKKFVDELSLDQHIRFPGYVSEEELVILYKNARVFVFPSLYEGFGLPPLEAMSCQTPVIVYNNSSLPEVVGNAAIKVENRSELKQALIHLLKDRKFRLKMGKIGRAHAKKYSWENSANEMRKILLSLEHIK